MNSVYNDIYKKIYGDKLFESVIDCSMVPNSSPSSYSRFINHAFYYVTL